MGESTNRMAFSFRGNIEPLRKADASSPAERGIRMLASTPIKDRENERVWPWETPNGRGMDLSWHLAKGHFTDEHDRRFYEKGKLVNIIPAFKIGEPRDMVMDRALGGPVVSGILYVGDPTHPPGHRCDGCAADRWHFLLQTLERSGSRRKVQCSVDGHVAKRTGDAINGFDVWESWVQDIALTLNAMNTTTWVELIKSLSARIGVHSDLDLSMRKAAHGLDDLAPYTQGGSISDRDAVDYLIKARGLDRPLAEWTVDRVFAQLAH